VMILNDRFCGSDRCLKLDNENIPRINLGHFQC
jgi:hypothetical protein